MALQMEHYLGYNVTKKNEGLESNSKSITLIQKNLRRKLECNQEKFLVVAF